MDRFEFTNRLKDALNMKLDSIEVQEQVDFYYNYIEEELQKGRSEQEVIEELGDPWAIARNIEGNSQTSATSHGYVNETSLNQEHNQNNAHGAGKSYVWTSNSNLGCWIVLAVFLLVIMGIMYIFVGVARLFAPILVPMILVVMLVKIFRSR